MESATINFYLFFKLLFPPSGNSNLVYTIIRKRQVFHALANLPCDYGTISRSLTRRSVHGKTARATPPSLPTPSPIPPPSIAPSEPSVAPSEAESVLDEEIMEGSRPAMPAEPGTLKATLPATPGEK